MRLAFCGLGQMGAPMAARLLGAGHDVLVWNRSPERTRDLVARGAQAKRTPAEAASDATAVVTMLATPAAVRTVVLGDEGVARGLRPGSTLVEMSTIGPAELHSVAAQLPPDVGVVDAPVLGSVAQATDGSLRIFAGGDAADVDRLRSVLESFGSVEHVGPLGAGAALKVVVNSVLVTLMTCLGEALALGDGLGLDEGVVLDALAASPLAATVGRKREHVTSGRYPPNFKLGLAAKDAGLVADAAGAARVSLRLAPGARAWFDDAVDAGLDSLDYSAVVALVRGRGAEA